MQEMLIPSAVLASERIGFRTELECDRRGVRVQSGTQDKVSTVGSRPTRSLRLANAFELPQPKDAKGDTRNVA
jgi:hypothetical protein